MSVERTYWGSDYDPTKHYTDQQVAKVNVAKVKVAEDEVDGSFINQFLKYCIRTGKSLDELTDTMVDVYKETMEKHYPKKYEVEIAQRCSAKEDIWNDCDGQCSRCIYHEGL